MKTLMLALLFVLSALTGCASPPTKEKADGGDSIVSIGIEYLSDGTNYRRSNIPYKLLPMKGSEFDLKLIKTGNEIKRIIKTSGLHESDDPDVIILFDFGSGGVTPIEHSLPYAIRGQTGVSSTMTTGTIYGNTINMTTTSTPTYGITGYGEHKYTTYIDSHYLSLVAIDAKSLNKGKPKEMWRAIVTSSGKLFDESLSLRAMLMAIKKHVGDKRDAAYSFHMKKKDVINPPRELELDVDAVAERLDFYLRQVNDSISARAPQPYSPSNKNQELKNKVKDWVLFCQKWDGKSIGCGMSTNGITVFIDETSHAPLVLVGEHEFLAPASEACLEIDGEMSCSKVEGSTADSNPPKQKVFRDSAFWKLEKAKRVRVSYVLDSNKGADLKTINMTDYPEALNELRRSLQ
ncbi:MAG: hypothetical protein U0938_12175 [Thiobacillus sp.]|nr:hypothetical protein [Thiobacillus sp.]